MPRLPEDDFEPMVPDWRSQGSRGFREERDSHGAQIDDIMAREHTKQANLRARLTDLGVDRALRDRCFVYAFADSREDTIVMPWEVIYSLIESDTSRSGIVSHRMGAQS